MKKLLLSLALLFGAGAVYADEVTFDFSAQGYENNQVLDGVAIQVTPDITMTFEKANGSTAPAYYNTGNAARLYGGNTLTIEALNGVKITEIAFTTHSNSNKSNFVEGQQTVNTGTLTADGTAATWIGDASSIVITNKNSSGHVRIQTMTFTYEAGTAPAVNPVKFSVASGAVALGTEVELSCTTEGAKIYYTLDGTDPTDASTQYTAPIIVNQDLTIRAIAYVGSDASAVTSATYTIVPIFSLAEIIALENNAQFVMGSDLVVVYKNGAYVYVVDKDVTNVAGLVYKYDQPVNLGDVVPAGWAGKVSIYNGLVELVPNNNLEADGTAEVPAVAEISNPSEITEAMINRQVLLKEVVFDDATLADKAMFTGTMGNGQVTFWNNFKLESTPAGNYDVLGFVAINGTTIQVYPVEYIALQTVVLKPAILPAYTELEIGDEITITCGTEGATIYYTMDGTDPTEASAEYTEPIVLTEAAENLTVKAVAYLDGTASEIAVAEYTVINPGTSKTAVFTGWNELFNVETEGSQAVAKNSVDWTAEIKGITLNVKNGESTSTYVKPTDFRAYKGYTMTFTAPEGYNIINITTTKGGKNFSEGIQANLGELAIENNEVTWTGEANELVWTITGTVSFATISVTVEKATGIETISSENAPEVYYNLQGVRVANPTNGIFVRVSGNKAEKIIK